MDSSFRGVGDDPRKCQEGRENRRHEGRPWRAPYGVGTTVDLILQGSTVDSVGEPPWRQESWGMNGPTPSIIAWSLFFGGGGRGGSLSGTLSRLRGIPRVSDACCGASRRAHEGKQECAQGGAPLSSKPSVSPVVSQCWTCAAGTRRWISAFFSMQLRCWHPCDLHLLTQ